MEFVLSETLRDRWARESNDAGVELKHACGLWRDARSEI